MLNNILRTFSNVRYGVRLARLDYQYQIVQDKMSKLGSINRRLSVKDPNIGQKVKVNLNKMHKLQDEFDSINNERNKIRQKMRKNKEINQSIIF